MRADTERTDGRARGARPSPFRGLLGRGAWLFAATVLAGLALRPVVGDALFVTRYTGYVMPWLLVALLPGALWACRERRWALAAALCTSAVVVVGSHARAFVPRGAHAAPGALTLGVLSFNTWSRNGDAARIARLIRAQAPDLVLLQEIPPDVFERTRLALRDLYGGGPVHSAYDAEVQQGVIGRYPLEPGATLVEEGRTQQVVVRSPAGPIEVFNVHPLRNGGWRQRYEEIAALLEEHVRPERAPVIVAGDFNASDHCQLYRLLARRLRNAHDAAGFGLGFTYPAAVRALATWRALPMVRIDHVFFSGHFVALRAGTLEDSGGSDHRPVFAELALVARSDAPAPAPAPGPAPGASVGSGAGPAPADAPRAALPATSADPAGVRRGPRRGRLRAGGGTTGQRCADSPQLRSPAHREPRPRTKAPGA